jgi:hypothetical protein
MATETIVGNDESSILFWSNRWLNGRTIAEFAAPNLFMAILRRTVKAQTVAQALQNRNWVCGIKGALTVQVLVEYLLVWDLVDGLILRPGVPDQHRWKLTQCRVYSSKSAYAAFFVGTIKFTARRRI